MLFSVFSNEAYLFLVNVGQKAYSSYSRTFDANVVLQDRLGRLHSYFVICLVTVLNAQIVVLDVNVQVGKDELNIKKYWQKYFNAYLVLDFLPNNPGHLIAIQIHDGVFHHNLLSPT